MIKYLGGLGAIIVMVVGYFVLMPTQELPELTREPLPNNSAPAAPEAIPREDIVTPNFDEAAFLDDLAADVREGLPSVIGETLTMTDAVFLPRMRIMEYNYVTTSADPQAAVNELRSLIEGRSETICIDGREMFELGVTLRNSFLDREGTLLRRAYLLPEDCQRYYQ